MKKSVLRDKMNTTRWQWHTGESSKIIKLTDYKQISKEVMEVMPRTLLNWTWQTLLNICQEILSYCRARM